MLLPGDSVSPPWSEQRVPDEQERVQCIPRQEDLSDVAAQVDVPEGEQLYPPHRFDRLLRRGGRRERAPAGAGDRAGEQHGEHRQPSCREEGSRFDPPILRCGH
jgi:hypothetical protein